jgi:secreted PhoX family phosphatase
LQPDPNGILDLPAGFSYTRLSETGQPMTDGYPVPGGHDGMAAFAGSNGTTILIRNHELDAIAPTLVSAPHDRQYDTRSRGGTTTLIIDANRQLVRHYGSLAGTDRNCAGGATPWGSWLSCEESVEVADQKHGYVFEVPSRATSFVDPKPLRAMGRFRREAAAIDPNTGDVYMTEDREDGLFYRFVPREPGNLQAGGTLYALKLADMPQAVTRVGFPLQQPMAVEWVRIAIPDPDSDTVRVEGFNKGAAQFARGEGIISGDGEIYFCCTSGGRTGEGQIWRYLPANNTLELYLEPEDGSVLDNPDNIVIAPNGDLFVCEDGDGADHIVGITPTGSLYPFARNTLNTSELAGVCFSPDGQTLFVNIQTPGITFAIWGPWTS